MVRSTEDFLGTQLSLLPLPADHPAVQTSAKSVSWLLKTLAIELRVVSAARMRSQVGVDMRNIGVKSCLNTQN